jgi:hypothetical protein
MTMEASTPAAAATERIVVWSYPWAAKADLAASRMARRVPADRGPPLPGTAATGVLAALTASPVLVMRVPYRSAASIANDCLPTIIDKLYWPP